jgi:hypothetical protein
MVRPVSRCASSGTRSSDHGTGSVFSSGIWSPACSTGSLFDADYAADQPARGVPGKAARGGEVIDQKARDTSHSRPRSTPRNAVATTAPPSSNRTRIPSRSRGLANPPGALTGLLDPHDDCLPIPGPKQVDLPWCCTHHRLSSVAPALTTSVMSNCGRAPCAERDCLLR